MKYIYKFILIVGIALPATPSFAFDCRVILENLAIERGTSASASQRRVQDLYNILFNVETALPHVNLRTLSTQLHQSLNPTEVRELTHFFDSILREAAQNSPFAADNLNHVALHYRDLERHRDAIQQFFGGTDETRLLVNVALLNAAAHDIGKIADLVGYTSPECRALFDSFRQGRPPNQQLLFTTILGHDVLTMDGIEQAVRRFGRSGERNWSEQRIQTLTQLLQAASARHNAGYGQLPNDSTNGVFHFWQTTFPQLATVLRASGLQVPDQYPAARGGWMPVILAMVDRGTALHPSFVEKVAGQGNFVWSGDSVGGLLRNNARSVRLEIEAIATELARNMDQGRRLSDFTLYQQYERMAREAEELGNNIIAMNNFSSAYPNRPNIPEAERTGHVYFRRPNGTWYRVSSAGTAQTYNAGTGHWGPANFSGIPSGLSAAQVLMRFVIGYEPINSSTPRFSL